MATSTPMPFNSRFVRSMSTQYPELQQTVARHLQEVAGLDALTATRVANYVTFDDLLFWAAPDGDVELIQIITVLEQRGAPTSLTDALRRLVT